MITNPTQPNPQVADPEMRTSLGAVERSVPLDMRAVMAGGARERRGARGRLVPRRAARGLLGTFGTRHEVTLRVLAKLAMLLHAMGRTAEAEEVYVRLVLQGAPPEEE